MQRKNRVRFILKTIVQSPNQAQEANWQIRDWHGVCKVAFAKPKLQSVRCKRSALTKKFAKHIRKRTFETCLAICLSTTPPWRRLSRTAREMVLRGGLKTKSKKHFSIACAALRAY
jgi:hypothetical protein